VYCVMYLFPITCSFRYLMRPSCKLYFSLLLLIFLFHCVFLFLFRCILMSISLSLLIFISLSLLISISLSLLISISLSPYVCFIVSSYFYFIVSRPFARFYSFPQALLSECIISLNCVAPPTAPRPSFEAPHQ